MNFNSHISRDVTFGSSIIHNKEIKNKKTAVKFWTTDPLYWYETRTKLYLVHILKGGNVLQQENLEPVDTGFGFLGADGVEYATFDEAYDTFKGSEKSEAE